MTETTIIYRATIDHLRTMILFDDPLRQRIEQAGKIDGFAILAIAHEYGVLRNLKVQRKGFAVWDSLAKRINALAEKCMAVPDAAGKAAICVEMRSSIVDIAGSECWSAISKWLWFAAPEGWLPCDKWVRAAHGDFSDSITQERFEKFYKNTEKYINLFRGAIGKLDYCHDGFSVYPERILDKALMIAGARAREGLDRAKYEQAVVQANASGKRKKKTAAKQFVRADERWWDDCSKFLQTHADADGLRRIAASVANLIDDTELPKVAA